MRSRILVAAVTAWVLCSPDVLHAQFGLVLSGAGTTVTFTLPVNLTQLPPDLERVALTCQVGSEGVTWSSPGAFESILKPKDEVWVFGGQVVTTLKVMVILPIELFLDPYTKAFNDPKGKTATYSCSLGGFSKSLQRWDQFSETATEPAFKVKGVPMQITGTFVW